MAMDREHMQRISKKAGRPKGSIGVGVPVVLADLRAVWKEGSKRVAGDSPGRVALRRMMAENADKFFSMLRAEEKSYRDSVERVRLRRLDGGRELAEDEGLDESTQRCVDLVGELLAAHGVIYDEDGKEVGGDSQEGASVGR